MKKTFFSVLMVFTIALTSCSSLSTGSSVTSTNSDLPIETQLALGTLKLNATSQDISLEQAEQLVVYWQVYKELSQSETAAQAEIDGLIAQIQETMTDDQLQAITDLQITQQDVLASMQGVTVSSTSSAGSEVSIPSSAASGGGMPAGGPPADGGAPPDGGISADMSGTAPASSSAQGQNRPAGSGLAGTTGVPAALVEAVIQFLQQKIAA